MAFADCDMVFKISLFVSICKSVCLELCNHKKYSGWVFDVMLIDTIEDTQLLVKLMEEAMDLTRYNVSLI